MIQPLTSQTPRSEPSRPVAAPTRRTGRRAPTPMQVVTGALKAAFAAFAVLAPGAAAAGRPGTLGALSVPTRRLLDVNVNCVDSGDSYHTGSGGNINYNAPCGGSSAASVAAGLGNSGGRNQNING